MTGMGGLTVRGWWLRGAAVVLAVVLVAGVPVLSSGADIYVHLLWAHQVMRCLAVGELPLWAPDLNAGFGSPGIRLYSPAGPVTAGLLGLVPGDAAAGLRLALLLAIVALVLVVRRRSGSILPAFLILCGAPFLGDLIVRAAWSQMLAVPVAWWLLEQVADERRPVADPAAVGVGMAALWLVHAPTAVMVGVLLGLGGLLRLGPLAALRWAGTWGVFGAALTAWHWLPLLSEMPLTAAREGLTGGIFDPAANWLGAPWPHGPRLNLAYSAAATVLALFVAAALRKGPDRPGNVRTILATGALSLTTVLVIPLSALGLPLAWLQFPWRWLTPAALLLAIPAARVIRDHPVAFLVWLVPVLLLPPVAPMPAPHLGPSDGWIRMGEAVSEFGGNPLVVDAIQNRPRWYPGLAKAIPEFGEAGLVCSWPASVVRVVSWRPLRRVVRIRSASGCRLELRLLRYPWWRLTLDGRIVPLPEQGAVIGLDVPPGEHVVRCQWGGNPLARVGLAIAAAMLLLLTVLRLRRDGPASSAP